jgi:hypothetical protein
MLYRGTGLKGFILFLTFILLGTATARAEQCNRFAVEITTTPVLYQWTSALEKATQLLNAPPQRTDTVLLGDSLLAFWPKDLANQQFGEGRVWNFAVGGSRTQHILWQLDKLPRTASLVPREVVVLIGTNNLSDEKLPACAIIEGIRTVVVRARDRWQSAMIHVMGIPPRGSDFHFRDKDRKTINAAVRDWIATRPGTHYFEVDEMMMTCGQYAGVAVASAEASTLPRNRCENYADDFGHFRRPGYDVIYSALRSQLN